MTEKSKTTFVPERKRGFWDKKTILFTLALCTLAVGVVAASASRMVFLFPTYYKQTDQYQYIVGKGELNSVQPSYEVHSTVYQYKWIDGVKYLIFSYSHPAALTVIGENFTAGKLVGAIFPTTDYLKNVTFISMGHSVGLTTSSTQLPGEWNRSTSITPEYLGVGHWNLTYSFFPSGSGTTNSTGWNWDSSGDLNLWAYDTFPTITYTSNDQIDVECEVDISYS